MALCSHAVCGAIKKQSQLGFSWNTRYLAVVDDHIKIFKTEHECHHEDGACKYSFDLKTSNLEKVGENAAETQIKMTSGKQHHKIKLPSALWAKLSEFYENWGLSDKEKERASESEVDSKSEAELEAEPEPEPIDWNERYRLILDDTNQDTRHQAMEEMVAEFTAICKAQSIALIENEGSFEEDGDGVISDGIGYKLIAGDGEYKETALLLSNWRRYTAAFEGESQRLYCPLSAVVEHLGAAVFCRALIPSMNVDNLVFGVDSKGEFRSNEAVCRALDVAAKKMNLADHRCKYDDALRIATSSKLEVYDIGGGAFCIDNASALFPVDIVHFLKCPGTDEADCRLHPDHILNYPEAISSDAFLPPADDLNDQIASTAIYHLHSVLIPKVAENINSLKLTFSDCAELRRVLREKGINVLYLGEIHALCEWQWARTIMLTVMAMEILRLRIRAEPARSVEEFEDKIRGQMQSLREDGDSGQSSFRRELLSAINAEFGCELKMDVFDALPLEFVANELECNLAATTTVTLCVPRQFAAEPFIDGVATTKMAELTRRWEALKQCADGVSGLTEFVELQSAVNAVVDALGTLFPGHFLEFHIRRKMCAVHQALDADSCPLFADCVETATALFGAEHAQTLLVAVELAALKKSASPSLLESVQKVFGRASSAAATVVDVLSSEHFECGRFDAALSFLKQQIAIMDQRRSFGEERYITLHLRVGLIAERKKDYAVAIRFLNKLYHRLKQRVPPHKQQHLWKDVDLKMLSLLMSRLKLMMASDQKSKDILKKLRAYRDSARHRDAAVPAEYKKTKHVILQNLCANPIQKTNDLLKDSADCMAVVAWVNMLREFETNFFDEKERVRSTDSYRLSEL